MGDINLDLNSTKAPSLVSDYLDIIRSNTFSNLIDKPTRVTPNTQTIIDHVLTNDSESILTPGVLVYPISDHYATSCITSSDKPMHDETNSIYVYRNITAMDNNKFQNDLEIELSTLCHDLTSSSVTPEILDNSFNKLVDCITRVIDKHAPLQKASRSQKRILQKPWLTKGLLTSIKTKQMMYKNYFLSGNDLEKSLYKVYANKLTRVKNLSKKLFYHSAIMEQKHDPKKLWKIINSVIPPRKNLLSCPPKLNIANITVEDPNEIAQQLNNYFVKIGQTIANNSSHPINSSQLDFKKFLSNSVSQSIVLAPPHPAEIYNIIDSLDTSKACGHDNIPPYFLRVGSEILAPILALLFSYVFELGIFPKVFKTAKVVPIFKSGNNKLLQNYRPISILSSLSKLLEKIIKTRLINFFEKHKVFYDFQYGFREKHSVIHALIDVTTLTYDAIQNKNYTALLLMDLRKAFDTVSHEILLQKLFHYGIRGPAHDLIESYLSSRYQFVSINGSKSSTLPISIGVPQGSILGPLLFLIYVNDLHYATSCKPRLFADYTCLVVSNTSTIHLELNCNSELNKLRNWCDANRLQINPDKSTYLHISHKLRDQASTLNLFYNNYKLACSNSSKYLGVVLDNQLHFKVHIANVITKLTRAVGIISKLRYFFPSATLLLLYYALVHPHLLFGLALWGNTYSTYIYKIQRLQNKAIRIITNSNARASANPLYRKLGILKVSDLYKFEIAKIMYQHSKQSLPSCFSAFFDNLNDIHNQRTRATEKKNLYLPKFSTICCQKSIRYQGVKIWNTLPVELRNLTFKQFKSQYKSMILESYI